MLQATGVCLFLLKMREDEKKKYWLVDCASRLINIKNSSFYFIYFRESLSHVRK